MPEDESLIPTGEVAKRLGVTPGAIRKWVRDGKLTPTVTTPGGRYRWLWSEVQRQLHDQRLRDE